MESYRHILNKLSIKNLDTGEDIEVMYNPNSYSIAFKNQWQPQERTGKKPEAQYTGRDLRVISMELFLDTYESQGGKLRKDVRRYTDHIAKLTQHIPSVKRPPILALKWGKPNYTSGFPRRCVLTQCLENFILFSPEGFPVRAKLSLSFTEYPNEGKAGELRQAAADALPRAYVVSAGQSLRAIAAETLKRPGRWREIARLNQIEDPSRVAPGTELQIPPRNGGLLGQTEILI